MKPITHPAGDDHWTRRQPDRVLRGCQAPGAKLSAREIQEVYELFDTGVNKSELAREIWRAVGDVDFDDDDGPDNSM